MTMNKSPSHQLIINNQKTFLSSGKSSRSPSSPQNSNSVPYDDQFLDVLDYQFQKLLYQNPNMSPSSSSPSPLPLNPIENLMTKTPPSKSPQTTGYNHSPAGEEDVIVMDGFLVTSSTSSPSLDGSGRGGKRSISKSSSESHVRSWENKKEHSPYGWRFQPSSTSLSSPMSSSALSPHSRQEKESLKPTLVTSSTPPSSLDVSNRSGGKLPVSKSSSESLVELLESINKDSLYDSRYQPSPTSLSSPPSSSSPCLRQVKENLKPTASPTSSGYSPTNSSRRLSDQVVCKYVGTNSCRYGSKCYFFHPNGGFNKSASSSLAAAPMMIPSDQQVFSATTVPRVYLTRSNHITQPQEAPLSAVQTTTAVTDWTPLDDNIINTADIPTSANPLTSSTLEAYINGVLYGPQQRLRGRRLPVFKEICPAE